MIYAKMHGSFRRNVKFSYYQLMLLIRKVQMNRIEKKLRRAEEAYDEAFWLTAAYRERFMSH